MLPLHTPWSERTSRDLEWAVAVLRYACVTVALVLGAALLALAAAHHTFLLGVASAGAGASATAALRGCRDAPTPSGDRHRHD
jgi:hypothetical protein